THCLDDGPRVRDEDVRIVGRIAEVVEQRRRGPDRLIEACRVDGNAVARAEGVIALALKCRTWIDEGEVDVEKHGTQPAHDAVSSYGPATTTVARFGSSHRRAAAFASSSVTASSSPGSRTSKSRPRSKNSAFWMKFAIPAFVSSARGIDWMRYCRESS